MEGASTTSGGVPKTPLSTSWDKNTSRPSWPKPSVRPGQACPNSSKTNSKLRTEWALWRSICSFLAHLNDLDFYKEVDKQREMCIAPWASCREGVHGKQSWPIECVGVAYEMKVPELIAEIQTDKVTMWVERGSLRYRGLFRAVEKVAAADTGQPRSDRGRTAIPRDHPGDVRRLSLRAW
jgi:hypothetical protein